MTAPPAETPNPRSAETSAISAKPGDRAFFGHPAGLFPLFFTEMWERFSYYGMRSILVLFMTLATAQGGLELNASQAGVIYALYTSLVYFAGLVGGWLADNTIGQRKAVFWGGVLIMCGHISLAFHAPAFFFSGLALIIAGTGLLKPNISTLVGLLYSPSDARRDSGFAIYYMAINIGSFFGQSACGYFAQHSWFKANVLSPLGFSAQSSWHFGFAAAAVGMFLGLVQFILSGRLMGAAGVDPYPPANAEEALRRRKILRYGGIVLLALVAMGVVGYYAVQRAGVDGDVLANAVNLGFGSILVVATLLSFGRILFFSGLDRVERNKIYVVFLLFLASVIFWSAFEQAGGLLNLFALQKSQDQILGFEFPTAWYQNINPLGIIFLSPFFAYLWLRWGDRSPSSPAKFAIGLMFVGLGFVFAGMGSAVFDRTEQRIHPMWLTSVYLCHSLGELFLSPIGLSLVTKLSPQRVVSQVMSIWFLANADANFLAGQTIRLSESYTHTQIFWATAAITIGAGFLLALFVRPIRRLMGGVH
jgi:POT family proton-dependent oligopeptide transporter